MKNRKYRSVNTDSNRQDEPRLTAYDSETGEFLGVIVSPESGDRIITREQSESYKERLRCESRRGRHFSLTDIESIHEVIELLDEKDCGRLLFLQCFVDYETNRLVLGAGTTKRPISRDDMRKLLGLGSDAFREFLRVMTCNGIVFSLEDGRYSMNDRYHFRGKTKNRRVVKSFTERVKRLYEAFQRNPKDLGFIYKLLPYVHYETNQICQNPHEPNPELIEAFNKDGIARITGVDPKTTYNRLRRLKLDGMYVFAEVVRGKDRFYKLNPFIFYRQDGEPDISLQADFLVKNRG
ncbi:hypothetical protein [Paenibacillus rigui]|uniref:Plasmid replication protein RepL domain-containing protein n=1 Tax=Paenibacillus rigui TaxID=554312 RepID=A0A229UGJ2_9BACL|nr:hypothetical protein [Paenibacillus rigui]OXM82502.1 hypothetical protein CF651_30650 [Paenibacillus rigui]